MSLDIRSLINAVISHGLASGYFTSVNGHEPKNAPGNGLTAAVWMQSLRPYSGASGLAATSSRVELRVRIYGNMLAEPQDEIDPRLTEAAAALIEAYSGDFDLGSTAMAVDLLGMAGEALGAVAGYLTIGHTLYRVMDITVPILVSDVWAQAG